MVLGTLKRTLFSDSGTYMYVHECLQRHVIINMLSGKLPNVLCIRWINRMKMHIHTHQNRPRLRAIGNDAALLASHVNRHTPKTHMLPAWRPVNKQLIYSMNYYWVNIMFCTFEQLKVLLPFDGPHLFVFMVFNAHKFSPNVSNFV